MRRGAFTRTSLRIMGSLLAWLAGFTMIYVLGAVACAGGLAQLGVAGIGFIGIATTLVVLAVGAFTVWQVVSATREVRSGAQEQKFGGFLALSLGGLVLFGLLLLLLPALVVRPACTGQPALTIEARSAIPAANRD